MGNLIARRAQLRFQQIPTEAGSETRSDLISGPQAAE
jgi:hypothetical protein